MLWVKSIMPLHTRLARILWGGGGGLRGRGGELYAGKGSLEGEAIEEGSVTVPEGFEESSPASKSARLACVVRMGHCELADCGEV